MYSVTGKLTIVTKMLLHLILLSCTFESLIKRDSNFAIFSEERTRGWLRDFDILDGVKLISLISRFFRMQRQSRSSSEVEVALMRPVSTAG